MEQEGLEAEPTSNKDKFNEDMDVVLLCPRRERGGGTLLCQAILQNNSLTLEAARHAAGNQPRRARNCLNT